MDSKDIMLKLAEINKRSDETEKDFEILKKEAQRITSVIANTPKILKTIDAEFEEKTGLTNTDTAFLFLAVGLQIARQYLLTAFPERMGDQEAAKQTSGHSEEHSDRHHRYYNPSLTEIQSNPVPFDANVGSDGKLAGGGKFGHRGKTLGHDPILGLIFGTANIATATLTTTDYESYHITTADSKKDSFAQHANTYKVLSNTTNKLVKEGNEGRIKVALSLGKEVVHLRSDVDTKNSLPLPIITSISPEWASKLAEFGLDASNVLAVGKQSTYSILINDIIALLHGMFFEGKTEQERKLYHVRTLKIISYSNAIASGSNLVYVAVTKNFKKLDLGGLGVTIYKLITNADKIKQIKQEFVFGEYDKILYGDSDSEYQKRFGHYRIEGVKLNNQL